MPARQLRQPHAPRTHAPEAPEREEAQDLDQDEALHPDSALSAQGGLGNASVAAMLAERDPGGEDEEGAGGALGGFAWWEEEAQDDVPEPPNGAEDFSVTPTRAASPASDTAPEPTTASPLSTPEAGAPLLDAASALPHQRIPAFNAALPEADAELSAQREAAAASLPELDTPTGLSPQEAREAPTAIAPVEVAPITLPEGGGAPEADALNVQLQGEADPARMQGAQAQVDAALLQATAQASALSSQDRGEQGVAPMPDDERLRAALPGAEMGLEAGAIAETQPLPPAMLQDLDAQAAPLLDAQLAAPIAQATQGQRDYEAGAQAAQEQTQRDIQASEQAATRDQTAARSDAQSEADAARAEHAAQVQSLAQDAQAQAQAERARQTQAIQREAQAADAEAQAHLQRAEQEADALKADAEGQVAAEQAQAEEGGLLDMAADAARAVVDGLKATVNAIYEGLRAAVAAVFEAAQALASGVIALAQRAVVALIALYAEALKGILDVALAGFPELAEALTARIDDAVARASALVQASAELLKQGVVGALGFLADTLDELLALSQSFYSAAFSLLGLALDGEWRALLEGMEGLVDAAEQAPPQFEAAAYEELLGGDLSQPLSAAELELAGLAPPDMGEVGPALGPPWSTDNVGVDTVISDMALSPELQAELLAETGGDGVVEFGWTEAPERSLDHILGLDAQGEAQAQPYDDGLSVRERAAAKWDILQGSLAAWWSANWPTVLGAGVLGVGGFVAANLLTGGAVLAALPPLMAVIGPLFMGVMVAQVGGYVSDYLTQGWSGDAQGGGKSLARALAVGAIELASAATFKAGSVALKGAKTLAKGARSLGKAAARVADGGSDYVLRQGKVLLNGVDDATLGQRARSLDALGEGLANKTRFKGYRVRVQGGRFELEGKINPWVLLANGEVQWKEDDALKRLGPDVGGLRLGDDVRTTGDDAIQGVVVGMDRHNKGGLVEALENISEATTRQANEAATLGVGGDDILPMYKHLTQADMPDAKVRERGEILGLSEDDMRRAIREQGEGTMTRMGQRDDAEILYALKAGQHEVADGGHSLLRHGPDVTDEALRRRLTEGVAPDLAPTKKAPPGSTRFTSYADWLDTREKALDAIREGDSSAKTPIDLDYRPGEGGNDPNVQRAKTIVEHVSGRGSIGEGSVGEPLTPDGQKRVPHERTDKSTSKVWPDTNAVKAGVNRVITNVEWLHSSERWRVVQHFPMAGETTFDHITSTYKPNAPAPNKSY